MKLTPLAIALAIALPSVACEMNIEVLDVHSRVASPTAKVGATYMVINNPSDHDVTLMGASTEAAKKTEIHTMKSTDEGVMQMIELEDGLVIPAGQCAQLARGGNHVMMMGLTDSLVDGDEVIVTLNFEGMDDVVVTSVVDSARADDAAVTLPEGQESCIGLAGMSMGEMDTDSHDDHSHDGEDHSH